MWCSQKKLLSVVRLIVVVLPEQVIKNVIVTRTVPLRVIAVMISTTSKLVATVKGRHLAAKDSVPKKEAQLSCETGLSCYCDASCQSMGDCCPDFAAECK